MVERPCELWGFASTPGTAELRVALFDRAGRWRRAIKGLAAWWGMAVVGLFVPVAHFFLVPGFLLAGLIVFWRRRSMAEVIVAGQGRCPDCGADQTLDLPSRWAPDLALDCRECHRRLRLTQREG
jgi:hypothetical protein